MQNLLKQLYEGLLQLSYSLFWFLQGSVGCAQSACPGGEKALSCKQSALFPEFPAQLHTQHTVSSHSSLTEQIALCFKGH